MDGLRIFIKQGHMVSEGWSLANNICTHVNGYTCGMQCSIKERAEERPNAGGAGDEHRL